MYNNFRISVFTGIA